MWAGWSEGHIRDFWKLHASDSACKLFIYIDKLGLPDKKSKNKSYKGDKEAPKKERQKLNYSMKIVHTSIESKAFWLRKIHLGQAWDYFWGHSLLVFQKNMSLTCVDLIPCLLKKKRHMLLSFCLLNPEIEIWMVFSGTSSEGCHEFLAIGGASSQKSSLWTYCLVVSDKAASEVSNRGPKCRQRLMDLSCKELDPR